MDDRLETGWKWVLRGLGILGFFYLMANQDANPAFYVLDAGLLGLPNVIELQRRMNREARRERSLERSEEDDDPDEHHRAKHGYVP
jgi:TctA family transporter